MRNPSDTARWSRRKVPEEPGICNIQDFNWFIAAKHKEKVKFDSKELHLACCETSQPRGTQRQKKHYPWDENAFAAGDGPSSCQLGYQ